MKKAQAAVLEHVLLMGAGVVLLAGVFGLFVFINDRISQDSEQLAAEQVADVVVAYSNKLVLNKINGTYEVSIPRKISKEDYYISNGINANEIIVITKNLMVRRTVLAPADGTSLSSNQKINIYYDGDKIRLS